MNISVHDNYISSYEVNCAGREITLRTEFNHPEKPTEYTNVIFRGVEGYQFLHDAFGNIILGIDELSVEKLLETYKTSIADAYRTSGAPGTWAKDLISAPSVLNAQGVKAFELTASFGMWGWILAKEVEYVAQPLPRADILNSGGSR